MSNNVKKIPDGVNTISAYLSVKGAEEAIEFYKKAFNGQEIRRQLGPGGKIMHAQVRIGNSTLMLSDEFPELGLCDVSAPTTLGGTSVTLQAYFEDVDRVFEQAVNAGAKVTMPLMDQFWGDRYGRVVDPFGHQWALATHIEDLTPEQMKERQEKMFNECVGAKK